MAVPLGASSSSFSVLDYPCSNKISFTPLSLPPAHDIPRFTNARAWRSRSSSPLPRTKLYHFNLKRSFSSPRCTESSSSSNAVAEDDKAAGEGTKTPFGYTRKDVLLIGLAVTVVGVGLKSGLEAGHVVQLVIVLGLTVGWISTYIFRVSNKGMTYVQQLCDYENKVMEQEQQRAMVNEMVAKITDLCWDKCITGSMGSSMSGGESTCLTNCARRYLDLSMLTMQKFKNMH